MSVLIKGMEMPKNCHECRLYEGDIYYCSAADKEIDILDSSEGKCQFCPLVPVPTHGRLIDADEAIGHLFIGEQCLYSWDEIEEAIDATETIIPAEEGE